MFGCRGGLGGGLEDGGALLFVGVEAGDDVDGDCCCSCCCCSCEERLRLDGFSGLWGGCWCCGF